MSANCRTQWNPPVRTWSEKPSGAESPLPIIQVYSINAADDKEMWRLGVPELIKSALILPIHKRSIF